MTPAEKSKLIFQMWQFKGAAESLGAAWQVVRLLTSWGCEVEWINATEEGGIYCIIDITRPKMGNINSTVGYGATLAESLCAAALRSVGLLATR